MPAIPSEVVAITVVPALIIVTTALIPAPRVGVLILTWAITVARSKTRTIIRTVAITTASTVNASGEDEARQQNQNFHWGSPTVYGISILRKSRVDGAHFNAAAGAAFGL